MDRMKIWEQQRIELEAILKKHGCTYNIGMGTVGLGWLPLIDKLCASLVKNFPTWDKEIAQIKEKFGGLRFYTNGLPDVTGSEHEDFYDTIGRFEGMCNYVCEECGTVKDVTREGSWIKTFCKSCREKFSKD